MKKEIAIPIIIVIVLAIAVLSVYGITGRASGFPTGCFDTDMNTAHPEGINYLERGTLTFENRNAVYEDECLNSTMLREYYCMSSSRVHSKRKLCECQDGICVE